jgi:hypothetical protein
MSDMKDYSTALRDWFYPQAYIPSFYGGSEQDKTDKLKRHVARGCPITWDSDPELGQAATFGGTFTETDHYVSGIEARVSCRCGKYTYQTLFLGHPVALSEIIAGVIAAGEASK